MDTLLIKLWKVRDYHGIRPEIRSISNRIIILKHIYEQKSFAVETTLSSPNAIEQARLAKENGFETALFYVAVINVEINIARIQTRAFGGGHSAPESRFKENRESS